MNKSPLISVRSVPGLFVALVVGFVAFGSLAQAPSATAQEPPRFNPLYASEEVWFANGPIVLAGTLTKPLGPGPHPAIVLMTGSGPQDRNEEVIPGFPIFGIVADYLTRAGLAVLRYDDRGVGQSTGTQEGATTHDLATDGRAAVAYLRSRPDIDASQVGLFGHSEGSLYAAIIASEPGNGVDFIVSMAGPAVPGRDVIRLQSELILRAEGGSEQQIARQIQLLEKVFPLIDAGNWEAVRRLVYENTFAQWESLTLEEIEQIQLLRLDREAFSRAVADDFVATNSTGWFANFLNYNPADDWRKVTVPVMVIFGGKDLQVDANQSLAPFAAALTEAGNPDFALYLFPDANHLFQAANSGAVSESPPSRPRSRLHSCPPSQPGSSATSTWRTRRRG